MLGTCYILGCPWGYNGEQNILWQFIILSMNPMVVYLVYILLIMVYNSIEHITYNYVIVYNSTIIIVMLIISNNT